MRVAIGYRKRKSVYTLVLLATLLFVSCPQPSVPRFDVESSFDEIPPDPPLVQVSQETPSVAAQTLDGVVYYFNVRSVVLVWAETELPIRYRLNGGGWVGPAANIGISYSAVDLVEGRYRFELQQRDDAGNWSESGSVDFVIDVTPPNAPIFPVEDNFTVTSELQPTVYWTGDPNDGAQRFEISVQGPGVDHQQLLDYSEEQETRFSYRHDERFIQSGPVTYTVAEYDIAGNLSAETALEIQVNTDRPVFTNLPEEATNSVASLNWSWFTTGSDGDQRYEVEFYAGSIAPENRLAAASVTGETGSFQLEEEPEEGVYRLRVRERLDNGSDWSEWAVSPAVVYDTTPPNQPTFDIDSLNLLLDQNGSRYLLVSEVDARWESGGGGGNGSYEYSLDGGESWTVVDQREVALSLSPGFEYLLSVRELDAAGNRSESTSAVEFRVDAQGEGTITIENPVTPTITLSEPIGALNRSAGETFDVEVTSSLPVEQVTWYINSNAIVGGTGTTVTIDSALLPVGVHSLTLIVEIDSVPYEEDFRFTVEEQ